MINYPKTKRALHDLDVLIKGTVEISHLIEIKDAVASLRLKTFQLYRTESGVGPLALVEIKTIREALKFCCDDARKNHQLYISGPVHAFCPFCGSRHD